MHPDGLAVSSARGRSTTAWTSIHEVFRVGEYWIVAADLSAVTIPRRVFADERAERDFVAAILGRIQDTARERSGEAAAFAA